MTTKLTDTDLDVAATVAANEPASLTDYHRIKSHETLAALVAEAVEHRSLLAGVPVDRAIVVDANDLRSAAYALWDHDTGEGGQQSYVLRLMDALDQGAARLAERDARDGA